MPRRKKAVSRRRPRRRYRRVFRRKRQVSTMPDRFRCKLVYGQTFGATAITTPANELVIGANSLFDPGQASDVKQPYFYDQMAAMYNKYLVHASKVTMIFATDTGTTVGFVGYVYPNTTTTSLFQNVSNIITMPRVRYNFTLSQGSVGNKVSNYMKTKRMYNIANLKDNEEFKALVSAEPATKWYWLCGVQPINQSTSTSGDYIVKVT